MSNWVCSNVLRSTGSEQKFLWLQPRDVHGDVMQHRLLREQAIRAQVERAREERNRRIVAVEPVVMKNIIAHDARAQSEVQEMWSRARARGAEMVQKQSRAALSRQEQLDERRARFLGVNESKVRRTHDFMRF